MNIYLRGSWQQRTRLASGLVLMVFAATHFINHALGLVSLEVMHQVQAVRTGLTRSLLGSLVLLAALVAHMTLGVDKLIRRRTLRMPPWEAAQIAFGLAIPFLLLPHIVNTRVAHLVFGVDDLYQYELYRLWPEKAFTQSLLLLMVWIHGCIGLHFWLRLADGYRQMQAALLVVALAVPVLGIAGFASSGMATRDVMADAVSLADLKARSHWPDASAGAAMAVMRDLAQYAAAALVTVVATVHLARWRRPTASNDAIVVDYGDGHRVTIEPGMTLLEASRRAGIPHASLCGGRGRCATCRVRVDRGLTSQPPPEGAEAITLQSIEAEPSVRLACQLRPVAPLGVRLISDPGVHAPIDSEFVEIKDVAAAHIRTRLTDHAADCASEKAETVANWLAGRLGYVPQIPDLSAAGFRLAGGRTEYLRDRPVAGIVYAHEDRGLLTLLILPATDARSEAVLGQRNGCHVQSWMWRDQSMYAATYLASHHLANVEAIVTSMDDAK